MPGACPLAVTDGGVCWSSASEAETSSVASPVCRSAFDDFDGDCWQTMNPRTWQALHHPRLPRQHQEHLDQREKPGRCAWTCWFAVDAV